MSALAETPDGLRIPEASIRAPKIHRMVKASIEHFNASGAVFPTEQGTVALGQIETIEVMRLEKPDSNYLTTFLTPDAKMWICSVSTIDNSFVFWDSRRELTPEETVVHGGAAIYELGRRIAETENKSQPAE